MNTIIVKHFVFADLHEEFLAIDLCGYIPLDNKVRLFVEGEKYRISTTLFSIPSIQDVNDNILYVILEPATWYPSCKVKGNEAEILRFQNAIKLFLQDVQSMKDKGWEVLAQEDQDFLRKALDDK